MKWWKALLIFLLCATPASAGFWSDFPGVGPGTVLNDVIIDNSTINSSTLNNPLIYNPTIYGTSTYTPGTIVNYDPSTIINGPNGSTWTNEGITNLGGLTIAVGGSLTIPDGSQVNLPDGSVWTGKGLTYAPNTIIKGPNGSTWNNTGITNLKNLTMAAGGTINNVTSLNLAAGGVITVGGLPAGGACPANQFFIALSSSLVPTCAAPAIPPATSVSSTAPVNPVIGQLWFDTVDLQTYIWYSDGTSTQWTAIVNQFGMGGGGGGGGGVSSIIAGNGLTGGTITTSGTIALAAPVTIANGGRGSTAAPTAGQIDVAQSGTAFAAVTMSGNATINSAGVLTITSLPSGLTINNPIITGTVTLPAGSITDAMLANAYSGVGTCTAGQFVNALNRNAAPTCATPAGGGGGIPEAPTDGNVYFRQGSTASWQSGGTVVNDIIVSAVHLTNLSGWAPINFGNPNLAAGTSGAVTASLFAYNGTSNNNLNITAGSHMWNGNWQADTPTAEGIVLNPTSISFQYSTGNTVGGTVGTWNSIGSFSATGLNLVAGRNYQLNGVNFGGSCAAGSAVTSISNGVIPTCSPFASSSNPTFTGTTTITNLTVSGTVSLPAGSITDPMLASAYSGIGTCAAGQFVNALTRNAAPTCAAPPAGSLNNPTMTGTVTFPDTTTWTTGGINVVTNNTTNAGWLAVNAGTNQQTGFWIQGTPYLWGLVISNTNPTGGSAWGLGVSDYFHAGLSGPGGLDIVDFGFQSVPVNPNGMSGPSGSIAVASFNYFGLQIGSNAAGANEYLDLGNVASSSLFIGTPTTPVGSLMGYAVTNTFEITSGGYYNGTNWKASGTTFENIAMGGGHFYFQINTGLTAGANVSPQIVGDMSPGVGFNHIGATNGADAPTGNVGEFVSGTGTTPPDSPAASAPANMASVSLGAGDWEIWGQFTFTANGAGLGATNLRLAISTASATYPTGAAAGAPGDNQQALCNLVGSGANISTYYTGVARVSSASAFTAYMVAGWTRSGTDQGSTSVNVIYARRIR